MEKEELDKMQACLGFDFPVEAIKKLFEEIRACWEERDQALNKASELKAENLSLTEEKLGCVSLMKEFDDDCGEFQKEIITLKAKVKELEKELKVDVDRENKAFHDEGHKAYEQGCQDGYEEAMRER